MKAKRKGQHQAATDAERRTGRHCSSVVQWRFGSAARRMRRLIDDGAFGRHTVTTCMTTWFRDAAYMVGALDDTRAPAAGPP